MENEPLDDDDMPAEVDFSKGVRGLHHIPPDALVRLNEIVRRNEGRAAALGLTEDDVPRLIEETRRKQS